jgi:hypothetical protein
MIQNPKLRLRSKRVVEEFRDLEVEGLRGSECADVLIR